MQGVEVAELGSKPNRRRAHRHRHRHLDKCQGGYIDDEVCVCVALFQGGIQGVDD